MSTRTTFHCNACGAEIDAAAASQFAGIWQGQATVAAGEHAWHSCSPECAVAHLRAVADAIQARGTELRVAHLKAMEDRLRRNVEDAERRAAADERLKVSG